MTKQRLYLETMEQILRGTNKIIIDQACRHPRVSFRYLPLPELLRRAHRTALGVPTSGTVTRP